MSSIHKLPPPPPGYDLPPPPTAAQRGSASAPAPAWHPPTPPAEPLHASRAISNGQMKALAKSFSTEGMEILAAIARDSDAPHSARVTAANSLLDRGHGKAVQQIENGNPGDFLDDLTEEQIEVMALEAAQKLIAAHGEAR